MAVGGAVGLAGVYGFNKFWNYLRRGGLGNDAPQTNAASIAKTLLLAGAIGAGGYGVKDEATIVYRDLDNIINSTKPTPLYNIKGTNQKRKAELVCEEDFIEDFDGQSQYKPFSPEAIELFTLAAKCYGLPESWGKSHGLHSILDRESKGKVGIPNYTIKNKKGHLAQKHPNSWKDIHQEIKNGSWVKGKRAKSSATGLGQLLLDNVIKHYPLGVQGIGKPLAEAMGMLNYIKDRYGNPEIAWANYGKNHEGY